MRERRFRNRHARSAVHERRRPQRRLAGQAEVTEHRALANRDAVGRGQLHECIVRMLAVHQRLDAVGRLAGLEQQRIAVAPHERIERHHRAQAPGARAGGALPHDHEHARHEHLLVAARAALAVVNDIRIAMQHHGPGLAHDVMAFHRRGVRLPAGAGGLARHGLRPERAGHVMPFVLRVRRQRGQDERGGNKVLDVHVRPQWQGFLTAPRSRNQFTGQATMNPAGRASA